MGAHATEPLRAITYLTPGIPLGFFEAVTEHLERALGRRVELAAETTISGPMAGDYDPFANGEADVGFVCSPSYLYLRSLSEPSVALVPAGFVFDDARNEGRPHYFSEVVVAASSPARRLEDLRGTTFGFNDRCSLSGYLGALQELALRGLDGAFFGAERCTGSHAGSLDALLEGTIDVAAIDSNALTLERRSRPGLDERLRVLETLGPHPIQPIVVRSDLEDEVGSQIETALLNISLDAETRRRTGAFGLVGCASIDDRLYADEERILRELGRLPAGD